MQSGWILIDKKENISSHKTIAPLKKQYNKVGHSGTLDPFASGLLLVAVGKATRLIEYAIPLTKSYIFSVTWGESRDTDDITGQVTGYSKVIPSRQEIERI